MPYTPRILAPEIAASARAFGAVLLTGPRRSGKTTLLLRLFPKADYRLLEDPLVLDRARSDPHGFLDSLKHPAILDEIQNVPGFFNHIRARIDAKPSLKGRWLLTGSQEAPLMRGVSESMAGRVAIHQLLPFSMQEHPKVSALKGGFPEVLARPARAAVWFRSYLQTYLERDLRSIAAIRDLALFRRFLGLLATRHGQVLNKSQLAAPLGISVPGLGQWLDILELTGQIMLVPPYFENFGKRLIKAPKLYFLDSGLVCHLLGIQTQSELDRSPFVGPVFEGLVASEIVKMQIHHGRERQLYYFRDQQGLEVDFVVPNGPARLALIEAKATRSPAPAAAKNMLSLAAKLGRVRADLWVVHAGPSLAGHRGLGGSAQSVGLGDLPKRVFS
jgi:uncharacterized protein